MHQAGQQCWYKGVDRLHQEFGITGPMRKGHLRSLVAVKQDEHWKTAMEEGTRMAFLSSIKREFRFERHLSYGVRKVRQAVTRFRVSDHNL